MSQDISKDVCMEGQKESYAVDQVENLRALGMN